MSKNKRYFLTSLSVTFLLVLFLFGLCTVDYHTRRIGFGDDTPIAAVTSTSSGSMLHIDILGLDITLPFIERAPQTAPNESDSL